nr:MAG TPA: hypothetical protein [Caudoviricetes sp.]
MCYNEQRIVIWYKSSCHYALKELIYTYEHKEDEKMSAGKVYDLEYKNQAIKLVNEIGQAKAAVGLGIPKSTGVSVYDNISILFLQNAKKC